MAARQVSKKALQRKRAGKSSGRGHWPIAKILAEAGRAPEASKHVANPKKPKLIYGLNLHNLAVLIDEIAEKATFENGKKIRIDTPILLSIVASFPRETQLLDIKKYERWKIDTVNFIGSLYKSRLRTVIEHDDEANPHLHFFLVPDSGRAKDIHPGYYAERGSDDPKEKKKKHTLALKKFQDMYWQVVGRKNGLNRLGPARSRLSRSKALLERENKKKIEETEKYCNEIRAKALEILQKSYSVKELELLKNQIDNECQKRSKGPAFK